MNNQEAFDKIWDWFVVQRKPMSTNGVSCRYRGDGGAKCAVGVLIPDELYSESVEGWMAYDIMVNCGQTARPAVCELNRWLRKETTITVQFLSDVQRLHDNQVATPLYAFTQSMKDGLVRLAAQYKLKTP